MIHMCSLVRFSGSISILITILLRMRIRASARADVRRVSIFRKRGNTAMRVAASDLGRLYSAAQESRHRG